MRDIIRNINKKIDKVRISRLIDELSAIGQDTSGGITRIAFSDEDLDARKKVKDILENELGLDVRVDQAANIIARRKGHDPSAPVIMSGSHLDTVKNGGKFDGVVGIVASIEAIRVMNQLGLETRHPVEIIIFTSEELNRFRFSTIGSRSMAGKLNKAEFLKLNDDNGMSFKEALRKIGGDIDNIEKAIREPTEILAYLELHIEQSVNLYDKKIPVGIVKGVTGIYRMFINIHGEANHSGTTPMHMRKDALVAASDIILAVNEFTKDEKNFQSTGTVGMIKANPNVVNIIPGEVEIVIEFRSFYIESINRLVDKIKKKIAEAGIKRDVNIDFNEVFDLKPVPFSKEIIETTKYVCNELQIEYLELISMAGHDANHMAEITKTGMIFIPSKEGLSHCPEEYSEIDDIALGGTVLSGTILKLDEEY